MSERVLSVTVAVLGLIAMAVGLLTMLTGAALIPGGDHAGATVDSELRFFGAWYAGGGALVLRAARDVRTAGPVLLWAGAILWAAATARLLGVATVGVPQRGSLVLLAAEYVIPLVLLPWQARVARRAREGVDAGTPAGTG